MVATFGIQETINISEEWIKKMKNNNIAEQQRQKIRDEIIVSKRIAAGRMDTHMKITKDFDITSANGSGPNKEHVLDLKKAIHAVSEEKDNFWTPNQVIDHMKNFMNIHHFNGGINNERVISVKDNLSHCLAKMFASGEVQIA